MSEWRIEGTLFVEVTILGDVRPTAINVAMIAAFGSNGDGTCWLHLIGDYDEKWIVNGSYEELKGTIIRGV